MKLKHKIILLLSVIAQTPVLVFAEEVQQYTNEASLILKKFGLTMLWVVFCVVLLVGILFLYKKYFARNVESNESKNIELSLETPKNINQALINFYERTGANRQ